MDDQCSDTVSGCSVNECRVNVWHCPADPVERGQIESNCERYLPADELGAADRFRLATTRNQHVVGRAMARRLLGDVAIDPQSIQFATGDHGKPLVVDPPHADQAFNIAHTNGLVLCGIGDSNVDLVGVDVESLDRRTSTELAERYFALPEVDFLRSKAPELQKYFFLRIWTLKEAYIKAIGTGLHTPLEDFAFEAIESDFPTIRFLKEGFGESSQWSFHCYQPRQGFIAAAAVLAKRRPADVKIAWQPFEQILQDDCQSNRGNKL